MLVEYRPKPSSKAPAKYGARPSIGLGWEHSLPGRWKQANEISRLAPQLRRLTAVSNDYSEESRLYQYQPLEHPTHIRILHLKPGDRSEPLRCRIEPVDLTQRPSYQAISYVWGSSDKPYHIEVDDGSRIFLTASLHDALRDIRSLRICSHTLWADAICINQEDVKERSQQIQIMDDIYRNASMVFTYIGPATPSVPLGLDLVVQMLDYASNN